MTNGEHRGFFLSKAGVPSPMLFRGQDTSSINSLNSSLTRTLALLFPTINKHEDDGTEAV